MFSRNESNCTCYWVAKFEIRVCKCDDIGNNEICHKQFDFMDIVQANITCSLQMHGDWVTISKTDTDFTSHHLVLTNAQAFFLVSTLNSPRNKYHSFVLDRP